MAEREVKVEFDKIEVMDLVKVLLSGEEDTPSATWAKGGVSGKGSDNGGNYVLVASASSQSDLKFYQDEGRPIYRIENIPAGPDQTKRTAVSESSNTMSVPPFAHNINTIATEMAALVIEKNRAYGDSFTDAGRILSILYPHGINPSQYDDALAIVRVLDKLKRIATDKDALGESPWRDVLGYAMLSVEQGMREKQEAPAN